MKQTFSEETKKLALDIGNGFCQCEWVCVKKATEFHHMLPNTKPNQKLFPLFLQSIFNCCPINHDCHMTNPKVKISANQASFYETWLEKFKEGEV